MQKSRTWILYSGYILALTAVFLYCLFPTETLSRFLEGRAGDAIPGCQLTFGSVKPVFPPGLKLEEIAVDKGGQTLFHIDRVRVSPGLWTLFSERPLLFVKSETCGGMIDGRVDLESRASSRLNQANLNLKGIALEKIAWLKTVAERNISGSLTGKLLYDRQSPREPLRAGFKLTGLTVELWMPLLNTTAAVFKTVDIDMVMNRQQLLVKRCVMVGEKVDGTLTGTLDLKFPVDQSVLLFSGVMTPRPNFREYLENNVPDTLLPKKKPGRNGYAIRIFGTLDNPRFSLK